MYLQNRILKQSQKILQREETHLVAKLVKVPLRLGP